MYSSSAALSILPFEHSEYLHCKTGHNTCGHCGHLALYSSLVLNIYYISQRHGSSSFTVSIITVKAACVDLFGHLGAAEQTEHLHITTYISPCNIVMVNMLANSRSRHEELKDANMLWEAGVSDRVGKTSQPLYLLLIYMCVCVCYSCSFTGSYQCSCTFVTMFSL